jgi:hypothetical protein
MDKENVKVLRAMIRDNRVKGFVEDIIQALSEESDELSDLGIKEQAMSATYVSSVLDCLHKDLE